MKGLKKKERAGPSGLKLLPDDSRNLITFLSCGHLPVSPPADQPAMSSSSEKRRAEIEAKKAKLNELRKAKIDREKEKQRGKDVHILEFRTSHPLNS